MCQCTRRRHSVSAWAWACPGCFAEKSPARWTVFARVVLALLGWVGCVGDLRTSSNRRFREAWAGAVGGGACRSLLMRLRQYRQILIPNFSTFCNFIIRFKSNNVVTCFRKDQVAQEIYGIFYYILGAYFSFDFWSCLAHKLMRCSHCIAESNNQS